jgi:hypothetical protein
MRIPIAHCQKCNENVPVFIKEIDPKAVPWLELDDNSVLELVICPVCDSVLNSSDDYRVEWYDIEKVSEVTNYKAIVEQN